MWLWLVQIVGNFIDTESGVVGGLDKTVCVPHHCSNITSQWIEKDGMNAKRNGIQWD